MYQCSSKPSTIQLRLYFLMSLKYYQCLDPSSLLGTCLTSSTLGLHCSQNLFVWFLPFSISSRSWTSSSFPASTLGRTSRKYFAFASYLQRSETFRKVFDEAFIITLFHFYSSLEWFISSITFDTSTLFERISILLSLISKGFFYTYSFLPLSYLPSFLRGSSLVSLLLPSSRSSLLLYSSLSPLLPSSFSLLSPFSLFLLFLQLPLSSCSSLTLTSLPLFLLSSGLGSSSLGFLLPQLCKQNLYRLSIFC